MASILLSQYRTNLVTFHCQTKKEYLMKSKQLHLVQLIIAIIATGSHSAATQAGALTCPVATSVTVTSPTQVNQLCVVKNTGNLTVSHVLTNSGTLKNKGGSVSTNNGAINNTKQGTVNNKGQVFFGNSSPFNNAGKVNNSGQIAITSTSFTNTGSIKNSGDINNLDGSLSNQVGGSIHNSGNITANVNASHISNQGKLVNSGNINIGDSRGNGTQRLSNQGHLINTGTIRNNAATLANSGRLRQAGQIVNQGTIKNSGKFNITSTGSVTGNFGTSGPSQYIQTAGTTNVNGRLDQGIVDIQGGRLSGNGTVRSSFGPVSVGPGATISPGGASIDTLNIDGGLDCNGCTLAIDIGGAGLGGFDLLNVNGSTSLLNAFIRFDFVNGFIPKKNQSFNFLSSSSFSNISGLRFGFSGLANGFGFRISNNSRFLSLSTIRQGGASVPEPSLLFLVSIGLIALTLTKRSKPAV